MKPVFKYGKSNNLKKDFQNIYLRVYHSHFEFLRSLDLEVSYKHWNKKENIINLESSFESFEERQYYSEIYKQLDNISSTFRVEWFKEKPKLKSKTYNQDQFRTWCENTLRRATGDITEDRFLLTDKMQEYAELSRLGTGTESTYTNWQSKIRTLKRFEEATGKKYYLDEIGLVWWQELMKWILASGNTDTYHGIITGMVKTTINHFGKELGFNYNHEVDSKKFKVIKKKRKHDVLTKEQMELIHNYTGKPYLENARDLAIIQFHACLRFSDLESELKKDSFDIEEDDGKYYWKIGVRKTNSWKEVELNPRIKKMIDTHSLPRLISYKNYNKYLKELCHEIGVDIRISTHTLRRSFCTHQWNAKVPPQDILKYSGHKTEEMLRVYINKENVNRNNSVEHF